MANPNGNQASGEMGRKICIIGLKTFPNVLLAPSNKPNGIAIKLPKPKPMATRPNELKSLVPMPFKSASFCKGFLITSLKTVQVD